MTELASSSHNNNEGVESRADQLDSDARDAELVAPGADVAQSAQASALINMPVPALSPSAPASSSASKKNFVWSSQDVVRLVSLIFDSESFQQALLPSREHEPGEREPNTKLRKQGIYCQLFKAIFPGTAVDTERIKAKLRWLITTYQKEKGKLSRTGAGRLLRDMDTSDPAFVSRSTLNERLPWFEKMHEMMHGRYMATPSTLITTPALDNSTESATPMDEDSMDHGRHGRNLPGLMDIMEDNNVTGTPPPELDNSPFSPSTPSSSQLCAGSTPGPSVSLTPSASQSPSSSLGSPKRKRGADKRDPIAKAYYNSSVERGKIKLQCEQERTKRMEMRIQAAKEKRESEQRIKQTETNALLEMARLLAATNAAGLAGMAQAPPSSSSFANNAPDAGSQ